MGNILPMPENNQFNPIKSFGIGATSAVTEVLINHPLWVMKTRLQCDESIIFDIKILYRGVKDAAKIGGILTGTRMIFMDAISNYNLSNKSFFNDSAIAFIGSSVTSVVTTPMELIQTQRQINYNKQISTSFFPALKYMIKTHGLRNTYVGWKSVTLRDGFNGLAFFGFTPAFKKILEQKDMNENKALICSGIISGGIGALITQPLDTIKTRKQANFTKSMSMLHAYKEIIASKGVKGLYEGGFLRAVRMASCAVVLQTVSTNLREGINKLKA